MTQRILVFAAAMLIALSSVAVAGNTGKIIGKVTDKSTGDPLFGVNVLVVGTTRGTTTDLDGKYVIIGVPIGSYTLRASQVGYGQAEVTGVRVGADETTSQDFKLVDDAVQIGGVTTTADAMLVNKLTTSSTQTVGKDAIESIPNVKSVEDVLKLQAGVVKQGNNLFLRGGRANEVQYLVDGIPTNNIVGNSGDLVATGSANAQLAALYAGVQSGTVGGGASGLSVSANSIQSVSVQTSGFDADYGNAQSGIINITTKSGTDKYSGSVQYRTDRIATSNQNEIYSAFSLGGPEPLTKYLLPQLGAEIPGNLTFFFSADMARSDGAYNYEKNDFYNPIERKVQLNGFLGGLLNGFGFRYRENQRNNFTFNSKLRYDLSGNDQISYGYRASLASSHGYNRAYRFRADSSSLGSNLSIQHNLQWTHFFGGGKSFIKMYLARNENQDGNDVAGVAPPQYSSAYENTDVNNDLFLDLSTSQRWFNSINKVWAFRFDFNSQVHDLHLLKTGFEFNYEEINSTEILNPTAPKDINGVTVSPPFPVGENGPDRGQYPGYGLVRWNLNNYPNRGGAYIQDNIEFSGLNIHIGLRYDYLDIGKQVFYDDWIQEWKDNTFLEPEWAEREPSSTPGVPGEFVRLSNGSSFLWYATHGNFSPRLSIGYPVTDRIVFYFNYGHFLQFPERDNYFRDPFAQTTDNHLIGNPDLSPQRTVAYEAGFEDQFTDDMAFALRAFYKDIFDYLTTVRLTSQVSMYRNLDYASARGFEITVNQSLSGNFSMNLSYSYQIAKGRSSNALSNYLQPEFQLPREVRLDWDQNHTANVFATYRVSPKEEGKFLGLNNYGVSLTWSFGSGFPYSPYIPGRTSVQSQFLQNSETKPYTSTVNLSLYKGFRFADNLNIIATLDVTNLLNRRNVISVQSYNGDAPKFGDYDPQAGYTYPWYQAGYRLLDPTNFDAPRQVFLGLKLNWE
jgi:outer membrane receptor protein involved in Fe transport